MAKWREVKQGKHPKKKEKTLSPNFSHTAKMASIAARLKAFLTDTFLVTTPILYIVMYLIMGGGEEFSQNRGAGWGLIFLFHFLIIAFFWFKKAQTPGMKAYSLTLICTTEEKNPSLIQIVLRYVATLLAVISFFLLFVPFFRKDTRTFQDIFSRTHIAFE